MEVGKKNLGGVALLSLSNPAGHRKLVQQNGLRIHTEKRQGFLIVFGD